MKRPWMTAFEEGNTVWDWRAQSLAPPHREKEETVNPFEARETGDVWSEQTIERIVQIQRAAMTRH